MPSTSTSSTSAGQVVCCIFCNQIQKKSGKRVLNLIISSSNELCERMKNVAESLGDREFLLKLKNLPIAYHKPCYASFLTKEKRNDDHHSDSSWHTYRNLHKQAFECIADFISNEIIENNRVMYFSQLVLRYQALLLEFGKNTIDLVDIEDYRSEMLGKKIFNKFGDTLIMEASKGPRYKKIIYKADIDVSVMANNAAFLVKKNEEKFDDVSFHLRNCIKKIELKRLPKRLTAEDVIRGECEIPPLLFDFMCNLIKGPHFSEKNSTQATTQVISICSDIIYAVTKGACKPAKNLTLGLALKAIKNSRQVITMLNKHNG
ncbi:PREDICTED: uncharacterized protein LOC108358017 [Rhagoletis zephyria]|uniref:uncharacterized protein LOC108358017 n=1 Tax=Rhagoletis zephyria TaxID=28612 RepID=UPI0008116C99|nr:PREDICTED: uncharacterized protein LOC108358017 [Rhagoletis zephyria]